MKGQEIPVNMIVIVAIAVLVLVAIAAFFTESKTADEYCYVQVTLEVFDNNDSRGTFLEVPCDWRFETFCGHIEDHSLGYYALRPFNPEVGAVCQIDVVERARGLIG